MCHRWFLLRSEIIWHKPNVMPSSVKDRFTVDFEKLFFFTKSEHYWFETQYEPHSEAYLERSHSPRNPVEKCNAGFSAGIVLDPFCGSGTTLLVAAKLGRQYLGFDINPEYVEMSKRRLNSLRT